MDRLGADVRVFDPAGLPMKDDVSQNHEKVLELRALSEWSDGMFWVSPEQHGTITAVFKNQCVVSSFFFVLVQLLTDAADFFSRVDWIPLSIGSVRPTQGRTLGICQVNGGSQSFNTVNVLRLLGRWMRMFTVRFPSSSILSQPITH